MAFNKSKYDSEYIKEKYHRVSLNVPKDTYDEVKHIADGKDQSVNGFIKKAIDNEILRSFKSDERSDISIKDSHARRIATYIENGYIKGMCTQEYIDKVIWDSLNKISDDIKKGKIKVN